MYYPHCPISLLQNCSLWYLEYLNRQSFTDKRSSISSPVAVDPALGSSARAGRPETTRALWQLYLDHGTTGNAGRQWMSALECAHPLLYPGAVRCTHEQVVQHGPVTQAAGTGSDPADTASHLLCNVCVMRHIWCQQGEWATSRA